MNWVLIGSLPLILAGCAGQNIADLVAALGKDQANVCVHVGATIYTPEVTVARVNMQGVAAQCTNGTLSTMPTAGVGVATISFPGQLTVAPAKAP